MSTSVVGSASKLLVLEVGIWNNEKKRWLWAFSDKTKAGLIGTGNVWLCISISDGDAKQWLSSFGVEKESTWRCNGLVYAAMLERNREKEKIIF